MKKYLIVAIPVLFIHCTFATPLSAIMTFESMTLTSEGVKKQTQFQERFIRDTNTVWSERIIPAAVKQRENAQEHDNHEHNLNFATAGKWLVRDINNNQVKLYFVRSDEHKIITPRVSEYGTLGFDGAWETAYYLVNRAALKKMTILQKKAPDGAKWYEKKDAKQFTRILWDEYKEIPLTIETGSFDGTANNKITLVLAPAPLALPWNSLGSYQTMAYEDLLD
jgi:hypothetical protein